MNIVNLINDSDSGIFHGIFFILCGNMSIGDDVSGISHFMPERNCVPRNKSYNGLFARQLLIVLGGNFFKRTAKLADKNNCPGFFIGVKTLNRLYKIDTDKHIISEADNR